MAGMMARDTYEEGKSVPNGGGTESRVGAALYRAFPNATIDVLERANGLEFRLTSPDFSGMGSEERHHRTLIALREDPGDHLHGAPVEHSGGDEFRIVTPISAPDSEVLTIRLIAPELPPAHRERPEEYAHLPSSYDPYNDFAKILRGEIDVPVLLDEAHCLACLAPQPVSPGHVLVIAKKPTKDLLGLTEKELIRLFATARHVAQAVKEALNAAGVAVIQRIGRDGDGEVPHVHIEVVPRFPGEGISEMPIVGTGAVATRCAEAIRAKLLDAERHLGTKGDDHPASRTTPAELVDQGRPQARHWLARFVRYMVPGRRSNGGRG